MSKNTFGLDIGATTIKLVWLEKLGQGFVLKSFGKSPTPSRGMLSESPLDEEEMAHAIQRAVESANITTKYVNVALSENQVYTKVLDMPVLSDRELRSAIYWEAEQYIPVPLSDITLTWSVLERPQKPNPSDLMQVLMVGAPIKIINKYQRVISLVGLTVVALETEILAATRALATEPNFPPALIINIGALNTSLAIVRGGIMIFTYSLALGGSAISRAIATDFGMTPQQAEEYKKVYGIADKALGGKLGQATQPILNAILIEAKKALAFYSQKYKDQPIRQVLLAGGTAKLPAIDLYFAQNLGIETGLANPWKAVTSAIPKEAIMDGADYVIAVGLAMRT